MVPLSMTLSDLWPRFQGHDIFEYETISNIWKGTMFGDLNSNWPLNASRGLSAIAEFLVNGNWRQSVKPLQFYCQCLPVSLLIAMRKIPFWKKMFYHNNPLLHVLANECHQSVKAVANVYNIKPHHIANSCSFAIKNLFWSYFSAMVCHCMI